MEVYTPPEPYSSSPLYVATTELPEEYREQLASVNPGLSAAFGTPIRLFSHTESQDAASLREAPRYLVPIMRRSKIQRFLLLEQPDGGSNPPADSDHYVAELSSLAEKTTSDRPLYLVSDGLVLYAVIGDTAYCLNDFDTESLTDYLPEIDTANLEVTVQKVTEP